MGLGLSKRLKVLVVDDELFVRMMAVDVVSDAGHDPFEAGDADEAVEMLEAESYDVVFTDIKMPGSIDGLGLAALVHQRWPTTHVIVTSGHMTLPDLPADTVFLQKPYRTTALSDRLHSIAS